MQADLIFSTSPSDSLKHNAAYAQLRFTRIFAWTADIAALVLVAMRYDSLPAVLPLTRWSSSACFRLGSWRCCAPASSQANRTGKMMKLTALSS